MWHGICVHFFCLANVPHALMFKTTKMLREMFYKASKFTLHCGVQWGAAKRKQLSYVSTCCFTVFFTGLFLVHFLQLKKWMPSSAWRGNDGIEEWLRSLLAWFKSFNCLKHLDPKSILKEHAHNKQHKKEERQQDRYVKKHKEQQGLSALSRPDEQNAKTTTSRRLTHIKHKWFTQNFNTYPASIQKARFQRQHSVLYHALSIHMTNRTSHSTN